MPTYHYKVCNPSGQLSELTIDADSPEEAVRRLRARSFKPISLIGESRLGEGKSGRSFNLFAKKFDFYEFTETLVPLLKAHIPLEKSLGMLAEEDSSGASSGVATRIRNGLHEGKTLSEMIRFHGRLFPSLYANLVEAGEKSGALVEVMEQLDIFLKDRKEMKNFLITSSIYPVIILAVTFGVLILLFTVFLPKFSQLFIDMNKELPLPTEIMIIISNSIVNLWWLWLLIIAGGSLFLRNMIKEGIAKPFADGVLVRIPVIHSVVIALEISRFFRTLSVLVRNNVHLLDGVQTASRVIQNSTIKNTLEGVTSGLREGVKLSQCLSKSPFVPRVALQMVKVGEESGQLSGMLEQIAVRYESILRTKIKRLLALFEPFVILFLSGVVLAVVLAIFMAVFEMSNI